MGQHNGDAGADVGAFEEGDLANEDAGNIGDGIERTRGKLARNNTEITGATGRIGKKGEQKASAGEHWPLE